MAVIGWGKPRIFISKLGADFKPTTWQELPTPVEGSTQLTTTKGDKKEAKIEGGENEDVRYSKNTYSLTFNIRAAKGRTKPIDDEDGLVTDNYAIALQPEDAEIEGLVIEKSRVSVEDTFSTDEGTIWAYTFDALKPASGDQVKSKVVTVSEVNGSITVSWEETSSE